MTESFPDRPASFEDRPVAEGLPDVADDDSPERAGYPEPEEGARPSEDGYAGVDAVGTTTEEQIEGESLDDKLDREQPEVTGDVAAAGESTASGEAPAVGGSLVEPDEGGRSDTEKDLVAGEAGPAGGTAEEQAVRIVEP